MLWIFAADNLLANPLPTGLLALLIANISVWVQARRNIEIMGLLPQLALLMLWVMPALHYALTGPGIMQTPMPVDPLPYFRVAIPGVLALCWAYFLPLPWRPDTTLLRENLGRGLTSIGSNPWIMGALSLTALFGYFGANWILPAWMQFLGLICRSLANILVLVAVFSPRIPYRYLWLGGLCILLLSDLIRTAMFGEFIGVLAIVLIYAVIIRQWKARKIILAQLGFALALFWLLSFKFEFRRQAAAATDFGSRLECLLESSFYALKHPFTAKTADVVVSRLNQGFLMGLAIRYVPEKQGFVHGETITTAVKASLVPRLFWPDKPKAGGVDNIRRFMGVEHLDHSINLGVVGEAYVNYGTSAWFVLCLVVYVLFFRLCLLLLLHQSSRFPFLLLLLPSIFFIVNFVEKDITTALNHVVKQGMVLGLVLLILERKRLYQAAHLFFT